jgi:hypothetical protein
MVKDPAPRNMPLSKRTTINQFNWAQGLTEIRLTKWLNFRLCRRTRSNYKISRHNHFNKWPPNLQT